MSLLAVSLTMHLSTIIVLAVTAVILFMMAKSRDSLTPSFLMIPLLVAWLIYYWIW